MVYLYLTDCTKAYDLVRHDETITQLTELKLDGKNLQVIKNLYWEQIAAMQVDGVNSSFKKKQSVVLTRMVAFLRFFLRN